ncbi:MAG: stage II sporulation protein P [Clostridia bacterium]
MTTILQRHFLILSLCTAFLFMLTGILSLSGNRMMLTSNTLQQAAANVSSLALIKMMGREIPTLSDTVLPQAGAETSSWMSFVFQAVTNIQPGDMRSLLGRELPGLLTVDDARLLVRGAGTGLTDLYVEYPPPNLPNIEVPDSFATDTPKTEPSAEKPGETNGGKQPSKGETTGQGQKPGTAEPKPGTHMTTKSDVVFIYHSHNRESWLSETKRVGKSVDHPSRNITLVGKRLAEELKDRGIGTEVSADDFAQRLIDMGKNHIFSYAESLKTVKAATERNRELRFLFDLHRDDQPREVTTVEINGKKYARLFFVIGLMNKNHEKNAAFATDLHRLLEKKYPGLSRGVTGKGNKGSNGEYNQSISPGSLLIEVGGTNNTLEESYNSVAALADVFADYFWQAERVSTAPVKTSDKR